MLRLFFFTTTTFIVLLLPSIITIVTSSTFSTNEAVSWAEVTASRLVSCYCNQLSGLWRNELPWQSGNTLETLANFVSLLDSPLRYVFYQTFIKTDIFVGGNCYDDHQWWLLGWIQAYSVDPNINYLHRAADIYDIVVKRAWNTRQCGGGIHWCPLNSYKNAITNELFLISSMRLHPYATLLGKSSTYYLDWALKEWQWFENSGMINNDYLINDGLR
ncbi:unnamed protein product [Didymodactylos carnosus]|nr:unnamed protein product [Didymodactylos carnosus]CAF3976404.1 unnamed protein product [Didymodactylos carnosus]